MEVDHTLMRAKLRISFKLEICKVIKKKLHLNLANLRQYREEFEIKLENRFSNNYMMKSTKKM